MQLAEQMLSAEGAPLKSAMERCVNDAFGFKGRADWVRVKPAFIGTPPRCRDFERDGSRSEPAAAAPRAQPRAAAGTGKGR